MDEIIKYHEDMAAQREHDKQIYITGHDMAYTYGRNVIDEFDRSIRFHEKAVRKLKEIKL